MFTCEKCGGPLESYDGELCCPGCCDEETRRLAREADEEAAALSRRPLPDDFPLPAADDEPPF